MIRHQQEATWPFLCILACLFILSATSPRAWEQSTKRPAAGFTAETPGETAEEQPGDDTPIPALAPVPEPSASPALGWRLPLPASPSAVSHGFPTLRLADPAERVAGPANDLLLPELRLAAVGEPVPDAATGPQTPVSPILKPAAAEQPLVARVPDRAPMGAQPPVAEVISPEPAQPPAASKPSQQAETADAAQEASPWQEPQALMAQLDRLARQPEVGPWASEVITEIQRLGPAVSERSDEAFAILDRLTELGIRSDELDARLGNRPLGKGLRQARFGLYRRLDIWRHLLAQGGPANTPPEGADADPQRLALAVADVDALTANSAEGRAWRQYLLLDTLKELTHQRTTAEQQQRRALALRILKRLAPNGMEPDQRNFISTGPLAKLGKELRNLAVDPVSPAEMMRHVEAYELSELPGDARLVAEDCQRLRFSALPGRKALGQRLESHYRNANLRAVLTEELLNRLMPARDPEYQWVNDTVLGSSVRGRSLAFTDVALRMEPDPTRLRMALEVTGRVSSVTSATNGPATFYNRSEAVYVAQKPIELGTWGLRMWPAEVEAENATQLRGLETDFDPIPLVGSLAQEFARSQHDAKRCEANREVERKVAARAKAQIDAEAGARLTKVSERLRDKVLGPMTALGLGPEMIESKTEEKRLSMRLRLGADDQLGGNTPRPWAPSDSLASFQIHQSAVNNLIERLDLAGKTFTLAELRAWLAKQLNRPEIADRKTDNDDVIITFAERDPVVVRCQDGRVRITLSIVQLESSPHVWTDFQVHACYRPEIDGQSARLVRDGIVSLAGELDTRSQIGLRGVFNTIFSKEKPFDLAPERFSSDPRMADLAISQFVIADGWMSVAVGPKLRGVPPEVARRPSGPTGPTY